MKAEDLFTGSTIEDNEPDYHVIVTDHPWMNELGLSVFTTGVLYNWWNEQNEQGEYKNRKSFPNAYNDKTPKKVLFGDSTPQDEDWGTFLAWRKEVVTDSDVVSGKYYKKSIQEGNPNEWDLKELEKSHSFDQLSMNFYNDIKYHYYDKDADPELDEHGVAKDAAYKHIRTEMPGISPITNVIAMNDFVRSFAANETRKKKDWNVYDKAQSEFITDIKASKYGYIQFSGEVTFDVNLADGTFSCRKKDWVSYKLYLYDDAAPRETARTATLNSMKFTAPPKDSTGRTVGAMEDGEHEPFDFDDPSAEVVADLDVTYDEYSGKWQSGSKQVLGIITQGIPAALVQATADEMKTAEIKDILEPQSGKHMVWGSGLAMPITMQNGNPAQWAPNYAQEANCRQDDKKAIVKAFNPDPNKSFDVDKMVLLNKIDGIWIAMEFGSGIAAQKPAIFEGRWQFSYHATNADFFYRDADGNKVDPRQVEKAFHNAYYADTPQLNSWSETPALVLKDGYHQFTSFDFMDHFIGGTRGLTRSLATTQFAKDPMGNSIGNIDEGEEGDGKFADGNTSGPFFGCVFPDGYTDLSIGTFFESRNYNVRGRQNSNYMYFNTLAGGNAFDQDTQPFIDKENTFVGEFDRNDCEDTVFGDLDGDETTPDVVLPMFAKNDFLLKHLPADIGTNASPDGINGRPIPNLHMLDMYTNETGEKTRELCSKYLLDNGAQSWLHKSMIDDGGNEHFGTDESAFDFKPAKPTVIQFRPLKAEVYAQFDLMGGGGEAPITWGEDYRPSFGGKAWIHTISNTSAASEISWARERSPGAGGTRNPLYNDDDHPAWEWGNGHGSRKSKGLRLTQGEIDLDFTTNYGPRISMEIWDKAWMLNRSAAQGGGGGVAPPGAVGVIGAVATAGSNGSFVFSTENYIGAQNEYRNKQRHVTWGGSSRQYDTFRTTDLSVTIYGAWPREQTIYDPRFFAVHHFNPDIDLGSVVNTQGVVLGEDRYQVDIADSSVDYRIPCVKPDSHYDTVPVDGTSVKIWRGEAVAINTIVYNDVAHVGGTDEKTEWLPSNLWNLDTQRRGKLLPYRYFLPTIGVIQTQSTIYQTFEDGNYTQIPEDGIAANNVSVVFTNKGNGYIIGDELTVNGHSSASFEVTATGLNGRVEEFVLTARGTGIKPTSFFKFDDVIKPSTTGPLTIVNKADAKGEGFGGYCVRGWVHLNDPKGGWDLKPEIATEDEIIRLSIPASNQSTPQPADSVAAVQAWSNKYTEGTWTTAKSIYRPSPDHNYDLFFHFMNDIAHTFMDNWADTINAKEQYVQLSIGVGGGGGGGADAGFGNMVSTSEGGLLSELLATAPDALLTPNYYTPPQIPGGTFTVAGVMASLSQ